MAKITYLFHSGMLIEYEKTRIMIDPFTGKSIKNFEVDNRIDYSKFKKIDYVLISHEHSPHCDRNYVTGLVEKYNTQVIAPGKVLSTLGIGLGKGIEVNAGDEFDINEVRIRVVKALHPQSSNPVGFILSSGGKKIYYTGDTYKFSDANKYSCDVLIAPIGGTYTMETYDAVIFARDVRAKYFIPVHYNTYKNIMQDTDALVDYLEQVNIKPIILQPGKGVILKE